MPLITSITPKKLDDSTKKMLKSELAKIMDNVCRKSETWIMIRFNEGDTIYFRGEKADDAAIVDIKLIGTIENAQKSELVNQICKLYSDKLKCNPGNMYITIEEFSEKNWGWNGSTF